MSNWSDQGSNDSYSGYTEYRIAAALNLYFPPFLVVFGTFCNVMVVAIMSSAQFFSLPTAVYMVATAVGDIACLLIALPAHWIYVNYPAVISRTGDSHYMCKFFNFFGWGASDFGIILTAAMTADRALAVLFPMDAWRLCTARRAKFSVFFLLLLVAAKDFHFLIFSDLVPASQKERLCGVQLSNSAYATFWADVWPWIQNVFLLSSFIVIITSNFIIIYCVHKSNGDHAGTRLLPQSNQTRSVQITTMLLVESFAIILLTFPFSIHMAVTSHLNYESQTPRENAANLLKFSIVFYLLYGNKCATFCFYCITGARFRLALYNIFLPKFWSKSKAKVSCSKYTVSSKKTSLFPVSVV